MIDRSEGGVDRFTPFAGDRKGDNFGADRAELAFTYSDLEYSYQKAGREAELHYASPDTSRLIWQCRGNDGGAAVELDLE